MAQARVPFLLGHAEIAFLYQVERQTSQKWRSEGRLGEPDLIASGNPFWLLGTVLQFDAEGGRGADQKRLAAYKASISGGYDIQDQEQLPVILGIKEVGRVLGKDAQAVSRWRNRRRIAEPDVVLSGSPLWLLETIVDDAHQRQRDVIASEVSLLRVGQRSPQKPRGRKPVLSTTRPLREPLPAARTFTGTDEAAATEFLTSVLAKGYSVIIKPQR